MTKPEAEVFVHPVDLTHFRDYCTVVPYPICLQNIERRLHNDFYRRKEAVTWDLDLLARNAGLYNEADSDIVKFAQIIANLGKRLVDGEPPGERSGPKRKIEVATSHSFYVDDNSLFEVEPKPKRTRNGTH